MNNSALSRVELLQGTLDLLILRTLMAGPSHGHAIAKHIQRTSEDLLQVETGSLYPALHRLEAKGWIGASWDLDRRTQSRSRHRQTHSADFGRSAPGRDRFSLPGPPPAGGEGLDRCIVGS